MFKKMRDAMVRFHKDEGGIDMVEYVLLIAIVALPLLAVIIWFWKDIRDYLTEKWTEVKEDAQTTN